MFMQLVTWHKLLQICQWGLYFRTVVYFMLTLCIVRFDANITFVTNDILQQFRWVVILVCALYAQVPGRCLKDGWNGNQKNRLGIPSLTLNCAIKSLIGLALFMKNISFVWAGCCLVNSRVIRCLISVVHLKMYKKIVYVTFSGF